MSSTDGTSFYTTVTLGERWGRSPEWVRRAANAREIPGIRIGGLWRFDPADIDIYETRHKNRDPLSLTPLSEKRQANKARGAEQHSMP